MDLIGDSIEINNYRKELDESIDKFKTMLQREEDKLYKLEDQRVKLEKDIETLALEIADEKTKYRQAIEVLLKEREKVSKKYLDDFHKEFPSDKVEVLKSPSNSSLIESVKDAIESSSIDLDIKLDTEKLRNDFFADNDKKDNSKEEYLKSMKQHLAMKHQKLI